MTRPSYRNDSSLGSSAISVGPCVLGSFPSQRLLMLGFKYGPVNIALMNLTSPRSRGLSDSLLLSELFLDC